MATEPYHFIRQWPQTSNVRFGGRAEQRAVFVSPGFWFQRVWILFWTSGPPNPLDGRWTNSFAISSWTQDWQGTRLLKIARSSWYGRLVGHDVVERQVIVIPVSILTLISPSTFDRGFKVWKQVHAACIEIEKPESSVWLKFVWGLHIIRSCREWLFVF